MIHSKRHTGRVPSALVLVHDAVPGRGEREVGSVGPALTELGFDVLVTTLLPGAPAVPDPADVDVIVVLGSAEAADDDSVPWLAAELDLIARAVGHGTPVLGICFGAQALARVLGGKVGRAPRSERAFVALGSSDTDLLPRGEWMQFHDDMFTLPADAQQLARNDVGLQAFACGPHVAVQFHPEITPDAFGAWMDAWEDEGVRAEIEAQVDVPAMVAEIAARADASAAACRTLVTRFCARAGVTAS
jgi:GMP synthase (glutamine-hydrolysing)